MSDPQYQNYFLLIFYTSDLVHGRFRRLLFDTYSNEDDDEKMEVFVQANGIAQRLDAAGINWSPAPGTSHKSALLCEAETEEKLMALRRLCTEDIKLSSLAHSMKMKQQRKQQFIRQRAWDEMDGIPAQIAALQAREKELRDQLVTRIWLKQDTAASKF